MDEAPSSRCNRNRARVGSQQNCAYALQSYHSHLRRSPRRWRGEAFELRLAHLRHQRFLQLYRRDWRMTSSSFFAGLDSRAEGKRARGVPVTVLVLISIPPRWLDQWVSRRSNGPTAGHIFSTMTNRHAPI